MKSADNYFDKHRPSEHASFAHLYQMLYEIS
ncbi:hypothetical protein ROE7235_03471 [Roseibaca ekhonensis]|uniref:Uncharacterized protein n=1 Tax=Roseinatronobacter ekhonensis TaxID=254356 RepID=A0A3B0MJE6_9RHOB|nr:hypothetical protein ROE7235_03471 [Roseibaca ekhonensis]